MDNSDSWEGQSLEENLPEILDLAIDRGVGWIWVQKDGVNFYQFKPDKNLSTLNTKLKSDLIIKALENYKKVNKIIDNKFFNLYEVDKKYLHLMID